MFSSVNWMKTPEKVYFRLQFNESCICFHLPRKFSEKKQKSYVFVAQIGACLENTKAMFRQQNILKPVWPFLCGVRTHGSFGDKTKHLPPFVQEQVFGISGQDVDFRL